MERRRAIVLLLTGYVVLALSLDWTIGTTPATPETILLALATYSAIGLWLIERGHAGLRTSLFGLLLLTLGFFSILDPSIAN